MSIEWSMTMSICGAGCELHYAGMYRRIPVQLVVLSSVKRPKSNRRIYVVRDDDWRKRPEFATEAELVAHLDEKLGDSEMHPKDTTPTTEKQEK